MSSYTATPTLIPRAPAFPSLIPEVPKPHPTPLPLRNPGEMLSRRNLEHELEDMSDEEEERYQWKTQIRARGWNFLHVIGRLLTQQEEKNDADEESEESESMRSGGPPSIEEGEGDTADDLDANIEDMDDEPGNTTVETEDTEDVVDLDAELDDLDEL